MERESTGFGFPAFAAYRPGSIYRGFTRDNEWFLQHCPHSDIATVEDIKRRTGICERAFAESGVTIVRMARETGANFLKILNDKGIPPEKCRGVLLGTCAVESRVLGLSAEDLCERNEDDPCELVQRTAERVAMLLGMGNEKVVGQNYACSTTARLTEIGIEEGRDLKDGEFFLMIMAEKMGANLDLRDRNTGFLFGDYTAVTALRRGETRFRILHAFADTFPSDGLISLRPRTAYGPDGKRYSDRLCIQMSSGGRVLEEASDKMLDAVARSLGELSMEPHEVGMIIPHQANVRFSRVLSKRWAARGWSKPPPLIDIHLEKSGNNGSASWARRMAERQRALKERQIIMAPFVGAGPYFRPELLSVGNVAIEVGE